MQIGQGQRCTGHGGDQAVSSSRPLPVKSGWHCLLAVAGDITRGVSPTTAAHPSPRIRVFVGLDHVDMRLPFRLQPLWKSSRSHVCKAPTIDHDAGLSGVARLSPRDQLPEPRAKADLFLG